MNALFWFLFVFFLRQDIIRFLKVWSFTLPTFLNSSLFLVRFEKKKSV